MTKKKNQKKTKGSERKSQKPVFWIVSVIVVAAAVLAVTGNLPFTDGKEEGKSFQISEKETRPVLDPSLFEGQTRAAYAAAKKYPEVMNEVFCYCYCDESPFHHKTLLSCFTEKHGAG